MDAIMREVRGVNPFEETVERIVQAIKLGLISPGDRLPPERELSVRLGVSRVTLRSAIRALQQAGYIESRRGRTGGSFVTHALPSAQLGNAQEIAQKMGDSLTDVLLFREVLEPGAAELAARRGDLTELQKDTLMGCLREAGEASAENYRLTDSRLHMYIAELSGSQRLVDAIADVQLMLSDVLAAIPLLEGAIAHSNDQHVAIVKAILGGQADEARKAMDSHVNATSLLLKGFLAYN
jgi:DNA-binding FadR family transcriptional regulator